MLSGLKNKAASPAISGKAPEEAQATGTPVAIASNTGSPTPSFSAGKIKASEPAKSIGKLS